MIINEIINAISKPQIQQIQFVIIKNKIIETCKIIIKINIQKQNEEKIKNIRLQ